MEQTTEPTGEVVQAALPWRYLDDDEDFIEVGAIGGSAIGFEVNGQAVFVPRPEARALGLALVAATEGES